MGEMGPGQNGKHRKPVIYSNATSNDSSVGNSNCRCWGKVIVVDGTALVRVEDIAKSTSFADLLGPSVVLLTMHTDLRPLSSLFALAREFDLKLRILFLSALDTTWLSTNPSVPASAPGVQSPVAS
jgi:hypothetical protein